MKKFTGKTALIVEDDNISSHYLNLLLQKNGFDLINADNGDQAIELFENNKIDIVLLDIQIHGLDGFEVIKSLKKKNSKIPIIVQSASEAVEIKDKCINLGCNAYLEKPVSSEELLSSIEKLLTN